ncbi:hypothetical protein V6N13_067375 [Hibiscus sabdariffa]|uniref:C2H2-type domain-containing protein n=1 Tax=Hibiscus sabdariffa TaxID=183260 RepID=A0ABR2DT83_9ROSI
MEQARCWMLMRRGEFLKSRFQVSSNSLSESWEEKAFAEDAAGCLGLGGCIWPPRSYTCSFCRREFRSAQALGGHMNVHRRDRAKLKQSHSPNNDVVSHQNQNPSPLKSPAAAAAGTESQLFRSKTTVGNVVSTSSSDDEVAINYYKRRKIDVPTLPFLVVGVKPAVAGSLEELDLELRL